MKLKDNPCEAIQIAVRCNQCQRIVAYKISACSGKIQIKCPKCGTEMVVDLSLRKAKDRLFYRRAVSIS